MRTVFIKYRHVRKPVVATIICAHNSSARASRPRWDALVGDLIASGIFPGGVMLCNAFTWDNQSSAIRLAVKPSYPRSPVPRGHIAQAAGRRAA